MPLVPASIPVIGPIVHTLGGAVGSIFSTIGGALLGAFKWTIGLATKFILTTIAALVKMLIPHSWVHKGLQIMQWIVAVPDYAGKVASPGGGHAYGFAGINALRDVFTWLGIAIAPLTLVYATSRAMIGESDPVGIPLLRMLAVTAVIVSYPYWWGQAAALADQVTNTILSVPAVSRGLYKLMEYAVDGVALGGWQLIDLGLMGAIGLELIGLIFLKVVVILLGALLYATGPVTIGLVPTRAGSALARAWASAAVALLVLGIAWATLFAIGALLIGDSGTAGPLIAGNSALGSLAGGLLLAVAGLASLWLCLKAARELVGLLRLQLSGLLVLGAARSSPRAASAPTVARTTGHSLREYGTRLGRAAAAAGGELALAGDGSAALGRVGRAAGSCRATRADRYRSCGGCAHTCGRCRHTGRSGVRPLAGGGGCGANGARRNGQLAGNAQSVQLEATGDHDGSRRSGRQRDAPERRSGSTGPPPADPRERRAQPAVRRRRARVDRSQPVKSAALRRPHIGRTGAGRCPMVGQRQRLQLLGPRGKTSAHRRGRPRCRRNRRLNRPASRSQLGDRGHSGPGSRGTVTADDAHPQAAQRPRALLGSDLAGLDRGGSCRRCALRGREALAVRLQADGHDRRAADRAVRDGAARRLGTGALSGPAAASDRAVPPLAEALGAPG